MISLVAVGIETWKLKTIESFGFDGNGIKLPNLMSVSFCSLFQNLGPQALTFSQRRKRGPHCTQIFKKIYGASVLAEIPTDHILCNFLPLNFFRLLSLSIGAKSYLIFQTNASNDLFVCLKMKKKSGKGRECNSITLFGSFLMNEREGFGGILITSNPSFLISQNWRDLERE